jgi:tetratricopeptide (TPR) repeat protein
MSETLQHAQSDLLAEGLQHRAAGRLEAALEAFGRAARRAPHPLEGFLEAGVTAAQLGRSPEAAHWFRAGIEAWPQRHEPYYFEGVLLASQNRHDEAVIRFRKALEIPPPNVDVLRALIGSLSRARRLDEAEAFAHAWIETFPADPDGPAALAHVLMEAGRLEEALAAARQAKAMAPERSDRALLEARLLLLLGDTPAALETLAAARARDPENPAIYLHLGTALKVAGQFDQARAALDRALKLDPRQAEAYASLAEITRFTPDHPLLAAMDRLAGELQRQPVGVPAPLHFALGKALDDAGEPDKAFHHFAQGNAVLSRRVPYSEALTLAMMEKLTALFTAEAVAALAADGSQSELPVFIVGLPRSGTTLVEQILASHPEVAAAGEVRYLPQAADPVLGLSSGLDNAALELSGMARIAGDYLARLEPRAKGRRRVTDKLPANALLIGLIAAALPRARIILCRRDLMDVGLSCFAAGFGERMPFATDLGALGRYIRAHERLMAHWRAVLPPHRLIEIDYESLVANGESEAQRLVAGCGLDWDPRCLDFHQSGNPVNTASVAQVREPLTAGRVGRSLAYEKHLAPLARALAGPA